VDDEPVTTLIDPRTGRERGTMRDARESEIAQAVGRARSAQEAWGELTPRARAHRLSALAGAVEDHADSYLARERAGTGKPAHEAAGELAEVVDLLRFYAWAARTGSGPAAGRLVDGHESWVRWEPLGAVAAIVPWNYPLLMAAWRCAPALAAGNTVLLKPAESTPDSACLLAEHAGEILGPGVLQAVPGDRETGRLLVGSEVDAIAFTGSLRAGTEVAARAGVRRVSLELGGNGPVVVLPDAPEDTWASLIGASTYNAGQSCAAPARVIGLAGDYERVVESLTAAAKDRRAGTDFGPLNNPDQAGRLDTILGSSGAGTAYHSTVDTAPDEQDGFWRPACVLADLPDDDPAVREEIFGPVLTVQRARDLDDAVRLANSQPQALAASVWSTDLATALSLAGRIRAGEVWLNCHLVQTAELPHGGRGASGTGTDLSTLALHEYQRPKTVTARLARA
jgi:betaine-aldehyde dehydrogenase